MDDGFDFQKFEENVRKLKKNIEKIGIDGLRKNYSQAYQKICSEISEQAKEFCKVFLFSDLLLLKDGDPAQRELFWKRARLIIQQENRNKTFAQVGRAILDEQDIGKAMDILADKVCGRIWFQAYGPYWISLCRAQDGETTCALLPGFVWDEESGVWVKKDEDGSMQWTLMLPPDMERIKQEFQEWR